MQKEILLELKELISKLIIDCSNTELIEELENYHDSDIADILETLTEEEQLLIYNILGTEKTANIIAYYENVEEFISEIKPELAADIIEQMDSDDAVDVLNELDEEDKQKIVELLKNKDKNLITKYGSKRVIT